MTKEKPQIDPSKRDRLKPVELIGFSAVLAVFAGLIVAMTTDDLVLRVPVAAISVFIVSLMVLALLGLSIKPNPEDRLMREDADKIAQQADEAASGDAGNSL